MTDESKMGRYGRELNEAAELAGRLTKHLGWSGIARSAAKMLVQLSTPAAELPKVAEPFDEHREAIATIELALTNAFKNRRMNPNAAQYERDVVVYQHILEALRRSET